VFSRSLMDQPLLDALGYARPPEPVVRLSRAALRLRGRVLALLPARRSLKRVADEPYIRSYPDGYRPEELGTFPSGCPAPHASPAAAGTVRATSVWPEPLLGDLPDRLALLGLEAVLAAA